MEPKFFGQFLLENGAITTEQLKNALQYQQKLTVKIGELAVNKGILEQKDAKFINLEQRRTDKLFGELAVELGFLTQEQLNKLIIIHQNNHIFLGQILIDKGYIDSKKLSEFLDEFHRQQKPIENLKNLIPSKHKYFDELFTILDTTVKLFRRMPNLTLKLGQGTYKESIDNLFLFSVVDFSNSIDFKYFIVLPKELAYGIAEKLYKDDKIIYDNETVSDFVREMTNIICGNITSQLLELGYKLNIKSPNSFLKDKMEKYVPPSGYKILEFPAKIPSYEFSIGIIEQMQNSATVSDDNEKLRVLIADDSELSRFQITDLLDSMNDVEIVGSAKSSDETLELFEEFNPNVVILDLIMPGVPIDEIFDRLIQKSVKVIILSGLGNSPDVISEKYRKGAYKIMAKPFNPELMKKVFDELLKKETTDD
ncbi:response regulator [bacterium]|nr:response regulator [bacterium]